MASAVGSTPLTDLRKLTVYRGLSLSSSFSLVLAVEISIFWNHQESDALGRARNHVLDGIHVSRCVDDGVMSRASRALPPSHPVTHQPEMKSTGVFFDEVLLPFKL